MTIFDQMNNNLLYGSIQRLWRLLTTNGGKAINSISSILAWIFTALIIGLRPLLGPACCKFDPSCTKFAVQSLANLPVHKALWAITKRLLSCNPFT